MLIWEGRQRKEMAVSAVIPGVGSRWGLAALDPRHPMGLGSFTDLANKKPPARGRGLMVATN